jgi:hypothetical protein
LAGRQVLGLPISNLNYSRIAENAGTTLILFRDRRDTFFLKIGSADSAAFWRISFSHYFRQRVEKYDSTTPADLQRYCSLERFEQ